MRKLKPAIYLTPKELAERLKEREAEAAVMPDSPIKQELLKQIGSLRTYLDMKLWIESPGLKRGR